MIEIDRVTREYPFPTIDFKFLNRSDTTALLYEFQIHIDRIAVDHSPELEFSFSVEYSGYQQVRPSGDLVFLVSNCGWGPALDCRCIVDEPILRLAFPDNQRLFHGDIASGAREPLIRLRPHLNDESFARLSEEFASAARHAATDEQGLGYPRPMLTPGAGGVDSSAPIPIRWPSVSWECHDAAGNHLAGTERVHGTERGVVLLAPMAFIFEPEFLCACSLGSDTTYCVVLNPDDRPKTRSYAISRNVAPRAAERFHIMIGACKSCELEARFVFAASGNQRIESTPFTLKIRNPRGHRLESTYRDGDEIRRQLRGYNAPERASLAPWERHRALESLQTFPFLSTTAPRVSVGARLWSRVKDRFGLAG